MNLNERPTGDWAAEREFDLRVDSYAQAKLWGIVEKIPTQSFQRVNDEWVLDQLHSVHVDLYKEQR